MTLGRKNLPASVRARLHQLARGERRPLNEILQYYAIERFLYHLSMSEHADKFILKGGIIFFAWQIKLGRPTRDIDLHGYTDNDVNNLRDIVKCCGSTSTKRRLPESLKQPALSVPACQAIYAFCRLGTSRRHGPGRPGGTSSAAASAVRLAARA